MPRRLILDDIGALVFGKEGTFLVNRNDVYVGKAIEVYGEYGAFENVFLKSLLKQGDNVIEVGANIGAHTISLAKAVGQNGKFLRLSRSALVTHCCKRRSPCMDNYGFRL